MRVCGVCLCMCVSTYRGGQRDYKAISSGRVVRPTHYNTIDIDGDILLP